MPEFVVNLMFFIGGISVWPLIKMYKTVYVMVEKEMEKKQDGR